MNRKITEEMNALSKEAYGSSSRWRKLIEKGLPELWEREKEVMVPTRNGDVKKKVFKEHKYCLKRFTLEEVKADMEKIIEGNKARKRLLDSIEKTSDLGNLPAAPTIAAGGTFEAGQAVITDDGQTATITVSDNEGFSNTKPAK